MKRLLDLCVSLFLLFVLFIPMIIMGVFVRQKIGSPILFRQIRAGQDGKPFEMYKFRTMTDLRNPKGELLPDDKRMTGFGSWLRATSLDELPELWNVLRADMSLVGPRPLLVEYLPLYSAQQARRHVVRPGVTGWAQVNGRNVLSWGEKFKLDVWYVDNQSFWLDIKILFLTVKKVILRDGVSQTGHVTVEKFRGSVE